MLIPVSQLYWEMQFFNLLKCETYPSASIHLKSQRSENKFFDVMRLTREIKQVELCIKSQTLGHFSQVRFCAKYHELPTVYFVRAQIKS